MSKRKYYIDRFDRGIQQSKRAQFEDPNVLGFVHCAHFDVFTDPKRLIPMPGFEDQRGTSNAADVYEFGGIGGNATKLFALGKALSGWYQQDWNYRLQITPDGAYSVGTRFLQVDLSNMPAAFWSNVKSNGGDIRVTSSDGETELPFHVTNFDAVAETGTLYIGTSGTLSASYYIYYGNGAASPNTETDTFGAENAFNNIELAYTLDADDGFLNMSDISAYELTGSGTGYSAASSPVGGGTSGIKDLSSAPSLGNNLTYSFVLNRSTTVGPVTLLNDKSAVRINLRSDSKLDVVINHTSGGANTYTTTNVIPASTFVVVTVTVSGNDIDVYFNDTVEINVTAPENGELDEVGTTLELEVPSGGVMDMLVGDNRTWSSGEITTYANNLIDNANFWTFGSEATLSAFSKTYAGFQLYEKAHGDADWSAVSNNKDIAALDRDHSPTNIPILVSGDLLVFFLEDTSGDTHIFTFNQTSGISSALQNLGSIGNRHPSFAIGADNIAYLCNGEKVYSVTEGIVTEVFDTGRAIWSVTAYRDFLGIGTEANEQNIVETYDFARTDPISTLDFGPGEVMLVSDLFGYLIGVAEQNVYDVFEVGSVNDDTLPKGMSVLASNGGDASEVIFFPTETKVNPADSGRKPPISQQSYKRKRSIIALGYFDDDDEKKGVWEIGINSIGQLVLNLLVKMPITYALDHIWGGYNYVYLKDGGTNDERIYRLKNGDVTGDYDETSFFETTAIGVDRPGTKTQVQTITVGAFARQGFSGTVTVKYKSNRVDTWTTIASITDFDNDGSAQTVRKVLKRTSSGTVLPTFEEGQFRVESTGGIEITEFEVEVETMQL